MADRCSLAVILLALFQSALAQYSFRVPENQPANTFVGKVLVKSGFLYDFDDKDQMFSFDGRSGVIRTRRPIDRESLLSDAVDILLLKKTTEGTFVGTVPIKVRVTDENDNPPVFSPDKIERRVAENIALQSDIALVAARDADSDEFGVSGDYRIEWGNEDGRFALTDTGTGHRGQLLLRVVGPLDREIRDRYRLKISVRDRGQPPLIGTLLVDVIVDDYNDNSPVFSPSKYSVRVNESSLPGIEIVRVFATDADIGLNKKVEYRFKKTRNTIENEFSIDRDSGSVKLIKSISCHKIQGDCTLVIEAFDHGSPSLSAYCYVTVSVIRINAFFPRLKISYVNSVDKTAYIEMGKITRKPLAIVYSQDDDQDSQDPIMVSITAGNQENLFALEKTHGNVYIVRQVRKSLDINVQKYTITITAVDSGSPPKETKENLIIKVNKANIHYPIFEYPVQSVSVYRNLSVNSFIANFHATDKDPGPNGKVSFMITNGNIEDVFGIDKESGLIRSAKNIWFVDKSKMTLDIVARDSGINALQSVARLHLSILQSVQMAARFSHGCHTNFVIDRLNSDLQDLFVYDFRSQIDVSDPARRDELRFMLINRLPSDSDLFVSVNGSLFMGRVCREAHTNILTIAILHNWVVLDKKDISVELTARTSLSLCQDVSVTVTGMMTLPSAFGYNQLIADISSFYRSSFYGSFSLLSSTDGQFHVSQRGLVYWRSPPTRPDLGLRLEIKYHFTDRRRSELTDRISLFFYPYNSNRSLIDCPKLRLLIDQNQPRSIQLQDLILDPLISTRFLLSSRISSRYVSIVDRVLFLPELFYSSYSLPISLFAYSDSHLQICQITISKQMTFSSRRYHFTISQHHSDNHIGVVDIQGAVSAVVVNISGHDRDYFLYDIRRKSLVLRRPLPETTTSRIMEVHLKMFVPGKTKPISVTDILIEFSASLVSPVFSEPFYNFVIQENSSTHTPLKKISVLNSQSISDFHLTITDESFPGKWSIFSDGALYLLSELDFEERKEFSMTIVATNKASKDRYCQVSVRILVEDCNDNVPRFTASSYYLEIDKNAPPFSRVGQVFALDSDSGLNGYLNYIIIDPVPKLDFIEINAETGLLTTNSFIETSLQQLQFRVIAVDHGNPRLNSSTKIFLKINHISTLSIHIESPVYFVNVSENVAFGTEVIRINAVSRTQVTYRITKSSHKGVFVINKSTGYISVVGQLDREQVRSHVLTIVASDSSDKFAVTNVYISVLDVNDNSPIFVHNSVTTLRVSESTKTGQIIAKYHAEDIDQGFNGTVRYQLSGASTDINTIFKIDPISGIVYLNQPVDYEHRAHWSLVITASDMGIPSRQTNLSVDISIINVNDNKPKFNDDIPVHFTVRQSSSVGATVGKVFASDSDKNDIIYTLAFVDPHDHPFAINAKSGIIFITRQISDDTSSYNVVVMAIDSDKKHWYSLQSLRIDIKRDQEAEIQFLTFGAIMLPRSAFFGDKIATVAAQFQPKLKNQRLVYSLVNCSFDKLLINRYTGDISIESDEPVSFRIIDLTFLALLESPLTENVIKYHSTKLILDHGEVHNLNFQNNEYMLQISECQALPGLNLTQLKALYPSNPISDLQYFITDIYAGISNRIRLPNSIVHLNKDTGWLSVGQNYLDLEQIEGGQITVEVVVIDRGRNASRIRLINVFINVIDCNDNKPIFNNETFVFRVAENSSFSQKIYVGTVLATDRDIDSVLEYSWYEEHAHQFDLSKDSGIITTTGEPLNFESRSSYLMRVLVHDGLHKTIANVLIVVDDVNDVCHQFNKDRYKFYINENVPTPTIVGQIGLKTPENDESTSRMKFSIISGWGQHLFSINADHGIITTMGKIDYEQETHYILLVTATDVSDQSLILPCLETITTTVLISIVDVNDNLPVFDVPRTFVSVPENISIGTTVSQLSASDGDKNDLLLFEIATPNDDLFAINPLTGTIFTIGKLDYETCDKHVVTVVCFDGLHSAKADIEVSVININDEVPVIHNREKINLSFINNKQQTISIKCSDKDNLETLSYDAIGPPALLINQLTGKITLTSDIYMRRSMELLLLCSDGLHKTEKRITLVLQDKHITSKNLTLDIFLDDNNSNSLIIQNYLDKSLVLTGKYNLFLSSPSHDRLNEDWNYFRVNRSTSQLDHIEGFSPRKSLYQVSVVAIPVDIKNNQLDISINLHYRHITLCDPTFIGTPYLFQIKNPVTTPRLLGSVSIGYCANHSITYYLSSGHSFFFVNNTTGQIIILKDPPLGRFRFKLSVMINIKSKIFLSTIVTVITTGFGSSPVGCQFNVSRILLTVNTKIGEQVGQVSLHNLSPYISNLSFSLSQNWPLSISRDGYLTLINRPSLDYKNELNLSSMISWKHNNKFNFLVCPIQIIINPSSSSCTLSVIYEGPFLEIQTFADPVADRFLFGIPVAHRNCKITMGKPTFQLESSNFRIKENDGKLSSTAVLSQPKYEFIIKVLSSHAASEIVVPVRILVLNVLNDVNIVFEDASRSVTLNFGTRVGSAVASAKAQITPSYLQSVLQYSLVYFCCLFPPDIAVNDNNIYQSFFQVSRADGNIIINSELPNIKTTYNLKVRASIKTEDAQKYFYKDVNVDIIVKETPCSCGYVGYFSGRIEENSDQGMTIVKNVLTCNSGNQPTVRVTPQWIEEFIYYDSKSNEIKTNTRPLDREKQEFLELALNITDSAGSLVEYCPGIINVIDVNDNPPLFTLNYFMASVPENAPVGTWIIDIGVIDADSKVFPLKFTLLGEEANVFAINSQNGSVFLSQPLDREQKAKYELKVAVFDGINALEIGMLVTVTDLNDNAPEIVKQITNRTYVINTSEFADGNVYVVTILATDNDDPGSNNSKIRYSIVSDNPKIPIRSLFILNEDSGSFHIVPETINWVADNETVSITIKASDRGNPPLSHISSIEILFIGREYEMKISREILDTPVAVLYTTKEGSRVGTVSVDLSEHFHDITYRMTNGNGSSVFSIGSVTGHIVTNKNINSIPMGTWLQLVVQACGHRQSLSYWFCSKREAVTIVISDSNRYSPQIRVAQTIINIPEMTKTGTSLLQLEVIDQDLGLAGMVKLSMMPLFNREFSLQSVPSEKSSFNLVLTGSLDYELQQQYTLLIVAHDLGSPRRSQILNLLINVMDEDDNAPYFVSQNFVSLVSRNENQLIEMPTVSDDDSNLNPNDPLFELKSDFSSHFQLVHTRNRSSLRIVKPLSNETVIFLSLQVSGPMSDNYPPILPPGRYSKIFIYLLASSKTQSSPPKCSYKKINSKSQIEYAPSIFPSLAGKEKRVYHLLIGVPRVLEEEILFDRLTGHFVLKSRSSPTRLVVISLSNVDGLDHDYEICWVSTLTDPDEKGHTLTFVPENIIIDRDVESGERVGRISIKTPHLSRRNNFNYRIFSNHYFPFFIRESGDIISTSPIYSNYPVVYNMTVDVRPSFGDQVNRMTGNILISVQTNRLQYGVIPLSLSVRENIGEGAIIASMGALLQNYSMIRGSFVILREHSEPKEKLAIDRRGIIRTKTSISRETTEKISVTIVVQFFEKTDTVDLRVAINDENNMESKSRNVDIIFSVVEKTPRLAKLVRLTPMDSDTVGNYKCRMDSLDVPRGVLITPDCWLYIVNGSSVSEWGNSSLIPVVHHDGLHKAVKSVFRLNISVLTQQSLDHNWVVLKLSPFSINSVINSLKPTRNWFLSFKIHLSLIAIDPLKGLLVIWSSALSRRDLLHFIEQHKSQIEEVLTATILEIIIDLCDENSCNSRGSCFTEISINNDRLFSDETASPSPEISLYPSASVSQRCACVDGYLGKSCQLSAKCSQQMCLNGGTCGVNKNGGTECECPPGYTGYQCDQDVNECESGDVCSSHGNCINIVGGFKCECHLNWIGSNLCNKPIDHCLVNPCFVTGTRQCIPTIDGYKCRCLFGNYGDKCQHSAISFQAESFKEIELSRFSRFAMEFSTILKDSSLITIVISSITIQVSVSLGHIRLNMFEDSVLLSQRNSNKFVTTGRWWKLDLDVRSSVVSVSLKACGDLNSCESTNALFGSSSHQSVVLTIPANRMDLNSRIRLIIGSSQRVKLSGSQYFVGCVRNLQLFNSTVFKREENNIIYNGCPRYRNDSTPCSDPVRQCNLVGKCVDEWLTARCECPVGYQPPFCSPGYSAFSVAPNTIISFTRRPQSLFNHNTRLKRSTILDTSTISVRIKTTDQNSLILMAFSGFHSYTLVQLENGFVKVVDKYAGSSQDMLHKAVLVNDNKIHTVTIIRHSSGTVSVTVDFVMAQVNWLQSHDIIGPSVQVIYLAGLPEHKKAENSIIIPNFSGCLSDVRFNNKTMPLDGLTETFNVSILQGSVAKGCSSEVCLQRGVCEKYQRCQEVENAPHSQWGQYVCVDDNKYRLLSILLPILLGILCAVLIVFIVYWMRKRSRKLKSKDRVDHANSEMRPLKKSKSRDLIGSPKTFSVTQSKKSSKTSRSGTSSSLLMQDLKKGDVSHPDLICSHEVTFEPGIMKNLNLDSVYYHDVSISNPYTSSRNLTIQPNYSGKKIKFPASAEPLSAQNLKKFNFSTGALKEPTESVVYQCSHPDDYEAVGSHQSSITSQDRMEQPKFPFAYQFQTQGLKPNYFAHKRDFLQSSSSSSNNSHFLLGPKQKILFPENRRIDDVFSNTDSNLTTSPQPGASLDSLSSSTQSQNVFTPTNSSDSIPSHKNSITPNSNNCWNNIQRALPPPPPAEDQYEYADVKPN